MAFYVNPKKYLGTVFNWIIKRKLTRNEDKIYSLMGILNTYIPPLLVKDLKMLVKDLLVNIF